MLQRKPFWQCCNGRHHSFFGTAKLTTRHYMVQVGHTALQCQTLFFVLLQQSLPLYNVSQHHCKPNWRRFMVGWHCNKPDTWHCNIHHHFLLLLQHRCYKPNEWCCKPDKRCCKAIRRYIFLTVKPVALQKHAASTAKKTNCPKKHGFLVYMLVVTKKILMLF